MKLFVKNTTVMNCSNIITDKKTIRFNSIIFNIIKNSKKNLNVSGSPVTTNHMTIKTLFNFGVSNANPSSTRTFLI